MSNDEVCREVKKFIDSHHFNNRWNPTQILLQTQTEQEMGEADEHRFAQDLVSNVYASESQIQV